MSKKTTNINCRKITIKLFTIKKVHKHEFSMYIFNFNLIYIYNEL